LKTGELNRIITISSPIELVTAGDVSVTWGTPETIRASAIQVDGSRFMREGELVDKVVYKIECWDNNYPDNIKIELEGMTLYPIRPIERNQGKSNMNELKIYASVKTSSAQVVDYWTNRYPSNLEMVDEGDLKLRAQYANHYISDFETEIDAIDLERSVDGGLNYKIVQTIYVDQDYMWDDNVPEILLYYRVRFRKGTSYSPYSNVDSLTPIP
jgi:hypothetical protein